MIYPIRDEHTNHYTIDVVDKERDNKNMLLVVDIIALLLVLGFPSPIKMASAIQLIYC